jgi:hypothetical protein
MGYTILNAEIKVMSPIFWGNAADGLLLAGTGENGGHEPISGEMGSCPLISPEPPGDSRGRAAVPLFS